ncbi:Dehydrogenase/reductase SDR member 11 [Homalodisca vitripennis]|nr:Dehydrogenase/reductase SDR member 11 [Homalodisca vitripennis]
MDKWRGKVVLVTGAAAGIGAAIATRLVEQGMIVVGLDIQEDRLKKLADSLSSQGKMYAVKANLRKEEDILAAFDWIDNTLGGADVLVNNAGLLSKSFMIDGDTENWRAVLEVNVLAVSICTREFLKSMKKRNNEHGHVIMINSVAAHTSQYPIGGMYYASKHGVKVLAMCLRKELADRNSTIKVTCVSPGRTRTDIAGTPPPEWIAMEASDVATTVVDVLSASPVTQICEVIMTPVPTKFTIY